jgi:hypothetical protein
VWTDWRPEALAVLKWHDEQVAAVVAGVRAEAPVTCDHPGIEHGAWSYTWPCPSCGVCKFIGHGPLCEDCYERADRETP